MDHYEHTVKMAKENKFEEIIPEHQLRYYKTIKAIQADYKIKPANLNWQVTPNVWIYGPTGTGKSFLARRMFEDDFYAKIASNKWWDKYVGQKNVLIEDFDQAHAYQAYYLKIWADRYAFPVEIKNGADFIRPERIIVTSNYSIRECFPNKQDYEPLERRFKQLHKSDPWNATVQDVLIPMPTVIDDAWEPTPKVAKSATKKPAFKKRKFDQPKVAKKPFASKNGKIVPNTVTQLDVDDMLIVADPIPMDDFVKDCLNKTVEITPFGLPTAEDLAKEKEVINVMDEDEEADSCSYLFTEKCDNCDKFIHICDCYEDDSKDLNYVGYHDESEDLLDLSDEDEISMDLNDV